jgi:hypothetical protein
MIKELLESRPPPLEDAPVEIKTHSAAQLQGLDAMRILPVKFQKYHVQVNLEINSEIFCLNALLDTGSDMNLIHKDLIPSKYWFPSNFQLLGLEIFPPIWIMKFLKVFYYLEIML